MRPRHLLAALALVGVGLLSPCASAQDAVEGWSSAPAAVGLMTRGLQTEPGTYALELRSSFATGKAHFRQGLRAGIGLAPGWEVNLGLSHHHHGTDRGGAGVFWGELGLRTALWQDPNFSLLWHFDVRFGNVESHSSYGTLPDWDAQQIWGTVQAGLELAGMVDDTIGFSFSLAFANHPYVRHQIATGTWCSGGSCEELVDRPIGKVRSGVVGGIGLAALIPAGDVVTIGVDTWLSVPLWAERYPSFIDRGLALSVSVSMSFAIGASAAEPDLAD